MIILGSVIQLRCKNRFEKTTSYFAHISKDVDIGIFKKYGELGVEELKNNTPKDTGLTSESWSYEIERKNKNTETILKFKNSNENDGVLIALLIQYGHGTKSGGFVKGIDYINPALKPIFEDLKNRLLQEVNA